MHDGGQGRDREPGLRGVLSNRGAVRMSDFLRVAPLFGVDFLGAKIPELKCRHLSSGVDRSGGLTNGEGVASRPRGDDLSVLLSPRGPA